MPGNEASGRFSWAGRRARFPWFSATVIVLVAASETATHFKPSWNTALSNHFAIDWNVLTHGEVHRFLFSPFFQANAGFSWTILLLVGTSLPLFEICWGTVRAAVTFFAGDFLSSTTVLLVLRLASELGNAAASRAIAHPDSGASAGCFACIGAFCASLPRPYRGWALAALWGFLVVRVAGWQSLSDCQHAVAAFVGMVLWAAWEAASDTRAAINPSPRGAR
ncbi:MAG: hypothetical protein AB7J35_09935 [Dehalococcoidia bacterium]